MEPNCNFKELYKKSININWRLYKKNLENIEMENDLQNKKCN